MQHDDSIDDDHCAPHHPSSHALAVDDSDFRSDEDSDEELSPAFDDTIDLELSRDQASVDEIFLEAALEHLDALAQQAHMEEHQGD